MTATLADGIHLTHGTHDGRVFNNHVHFTGDDLIAIVSYRQKPDGSVTYPDPCHDDIVFQNVGNYNFWGRGVSVVGGTRVAQENNKVSHTMGAGDKIASEASFFTYGVTSAIARGNLIADARGAAAAVHSPGTPSDGLPDQINQAALDLDGAAGFPLQGVRLIHNTVDGAGAGGLVARASTHASDLELTDNEFSAINLASGRTDVPVVWLVNFNAGPVLSIGNVFHDTDAQSHARWFLFNENSPGVTNLGHGNIFQENHSDSGQFLSRQLGVVPEEQRH